MDLFRRLAVLTVARDAAFVALAASTLMLAFSFHPPLALLLGANVALVFCLGLIARSWRLSDARIVRSEPWRALTREERPVGSEARATARDTLETLLLRVARVAALAAVVLSASSLTISLARPPAPHALASAGAHALATTTAR